MGGGVDANCFLSTFKKKQPNDRNTRFRCAVTCAGRNNNPAAVWIPSRRHEDVITGNESALVFLGDPFFFVTPQNVFIPCGFAARERCGKHHLSVRQTSRTARLTSPSLCRTGGGAWKGNTLSIINAINSPRCKVITVRETDDCRRL